MSSTHAGPVIVSLNDLKTNNVSFSELEHAFGPDSLGIIVVKDLPPDFPEFRRSLLSYSSYLGNLPAEELEKLESARSKWLVGWSCGKETLKDGRFDTLKGSYYVNCNPSFSDPSVQKNLESRFPSFPEYTAPNFWPEDAVLPGFKDAFTSLCNLILDVAALVARACDKYGEERIEDYRTGCLEHIVTTSHVSKARLLHYFPSDSQDSSDSAQEDDWCGTHVDHGCLTGLTSAMFIDEAANKPNIPSGQNSTSPLPELDAPPDPNAGLYIHSRSGNVVKVKIPRDCLAFQTGEALELITKGKFRAVPHFVRGVAPGRGGKVARNTLAVFTQPNLWEMVDERRDFATFAREIVERNH